MFSLLSSFNSKAPAGQSFETQKPQPMLEKQSIVASQLTSKTEMHSYISSNSQIPTRIRNIQRFIPVFPLRSPITRKPVFFELHSAKTAGNKSLCRTQVLPSDHHKRKSAKQTNRNSTKNRTFLQKPSEVQRNLLNITDLLGEIMPHRDSF